MKMQKTTITAKKEKKTNTDFNLSTEETEDNLAN